MTICRLDGILLKGTFAVKIRESRPMRSQSDFRLDLHRLADDIAKEGGDDDERISNLICVLNSMTPATCGVYL